MVPFIISVRLHSTVPVHLASPNSHMSAFPYLCAFLLSFQVSSSSRLVSPIIIDANPRSHLFVQLSTKLTFVNSSCTINKVDLHTVSTISSIMMGSRVSVNSCQISSSSTEPLIENQMGSNLLLCDIGVVCFSLLPSLVSSNPKSSIEMIQSSFKDFVSEGGNFVMNGEAMQEIIYGCEFENITQNGVGSVSKSEYSNVDTTVMKDVENGIYGGIIGGISEQTGKKFEIRNCTLISNFRVGRARRRYREVNADVCTDSVTSDCSTSSRIVLSTETEYTFSNCTFTDCYAEDGDGGALYFNGTDSSTTFSLSISECSFTNCYTSATQTGDTYGGAIYCTYAQTFQLTLTNFTDCHTPYGNLTHNSNHYGGAIYAYYITTDCVSSSCIFTNCTTGYSAGGWYEESFNVSDDSDALTKCAFIYCSRNSTSGNAGRASGLYIYPSSVQSISECLFYRCYNTWGGGG